MLTCAGGGGKTKSTGSIACLIVASYRTAKCAASMKACAKCSLPHLESPAPFFLPFDSRRLSIARA